MRFHKENSLPSIKVLHMTGAQLLYIADVERKRLFEPLMALKHAVIEFTA